MSEISWTQKTWNPVAGCSIESPGCRNCYAMSMARRLDAMGLDKYKGLTKSEKGRPVWTGEVRMADEAALTLPATWKAPRIVFVNSMSDLFHEDLPDRDIKRLLDFMAETDRHIYQVLTKRAANMSRVMTDWLNESGHSRIPGHIWPGVSVEDQRRADDRIPLLAALPAETRFVSLEPLLEEVRLDALPLVEWYIVGGESAAKKRARGFHTDWARRIRDAVRPRAAFHMKQAGSRRLDGDGGNGKNDRLSDLPADLRIREWPARAPALDKDIS